MGEALYTENDPSIVFNLYKQNNAYTVPGPALYSGKKVRRELEN